MEKIRQMAKEQGVDLAVQGLVCLPWELKKYTGCIWRRQRRGGVTHVVIIRHVHFKLQKSFKTETEAEQYLRDVCVWEGLPIRNKFIVFKDRVEVELTKGKILICNYADLDIVEMHTWHFTRGYVATNISGSTYQYFHNIIMKHPTGIAVTVDHINRNSLDNHQANLRLVDKTTQCINQGMKSNNKSSVMGVSYDKRGGNWVAMWQDTEGNQCCKWFASKKYTNDIAKAMAIEH